MLLVFNPHTHQYKKTNIENFLTIRASSGTAKEIENDNWFVKNGKVIHKNKTGEWKTIAEAEGIQSSMLFSRDNIFVDGKNRVWLNSGYGIFLWNGNRFNLFPGMEKVVIPGANPSFGYMVEDHHQGIWASMNKTLAYLPNNETRFHVFPKEYLNIQTLHNITIDREQNIWVATDRGLIKLSKTKVINYAEAQGIQNNRVSSISEVSKNKFIITTPTEQLYWLENKTITPFKPRNSSISKSTFNYISNKVDSEGNIWLGHQRGIIKISKTKEIDIKAPNQVRYIEEGIDGRIYVAIAFNGIGYINEKLELQMLSISKTDFKQAYFSSLHQLKDSSLLATTYRTGAMIIDKKGAIQQLDLFGGITGIAIFNALELDNGEIWFATGKGIVKWVNDKATIIGTESGLTEPSIFGILIDKKGEWWLPSNKGVIHAPFSEIEAYSNNNKATINWKIIDDADGMNNRQCVGARHSIVASDGKLYIVGIGGLVEINPDSLSSNTIPPLVAINQLKVDDSLFFAKQPNIISPGSHRYIFDYSALSFVAPDKNQIYFRLVGQDKDWIHSTGDNRAIYTNLEPGNYRFEVKATNNDGVWSAAPAVIEFTVDAFFYQTIWFKIVCALLTLATILLIVRWRTRVEREKNTWLESEVNKRTKELQASIETIKATQTQLIQSEKMASLGELTAGIAHEIQNPLNFVNNFSEVNMELIDELKTEVRSLAPLEMTDKKSGFANQLIDDIKDNSEKINHHGKRAADIVKSMLLHSRSSVGVKEPTDINALCDEYLRLSYHGLRAKDNSFNATTKTNFDESIGNINIIPQDIVRVVMNLLTNAFYAVGEKSRIFNLESENQKSRDAYEPTVSISTKKLDGKILITVSDNGNGISEKVLDRIFQPFFTTKPTGQGTGLGLSMSYDIVTKGHGGELKVKTKEGEGTEFVIKLPV